MPALPNPAWETFAQAKANGKTGTLAYVEAGFSARGARGNASRLLANPDVSLQVQELVISISKRAEHGIVTRRITDRNARIAELQQRWDELREIYESAARL
jgi:phage terminase small subunit